MHRSKNSQNKKIIWKSLNHDKTMLCHFKRDNLQHFLICCNNFYAPLSGFCSGNNTFGDTGLVFTVADTNPNLRLLLSTIVPAMINYTA